MTDVTYRPPVPEKTAWHLRAFDLLLRAASSLVTLSVASQTASPDVGNVAGTWQPGMTHTQPLHKR